MHQSNQISHDGQLCSGVIQGAKAEVDTCLSYQANIEVIALYIGHCLGVLWVPVACLVLFFGVVVFSGVKGQGSGIMR